MKIHRTHTQPLPLVTYHPLRVDEENSVVVDNPVCQEIPLSIHINDRLYTTLMRTPGLERELAVGACFTDDLLRSVADIADIRCVTEGDSPYITDVTLTIPTLMGKEVTQENTVKSASGAIHRGQILEQVLQRIPPIASRKTFALNTLRTLPEQLNGCQILRAKCGATHGAALFDGRGTLLVCAEDIGRHNGLDKLIGHILLHRIETSETMLMLSSRASFEMIQKAIRVGIPVVASVSAPTDLALRVAERLHCTYVSFLKRGSFFIYTHPWRFGVPGEKGS